MKITIYALHLGFGGVEKYICTVANMLAKKHTIEIVSTYKLQEQPSFHLDNRVKVSYLISNMRPNKGTLKLAIQQRNVLKIMKEGVYALKLLWLKKRENIKSIKACESDVIFSTRDFHNVLIAKYAPKSAVLISSEHNHHNNDEKYIRKIVHSLQGFDYFLPISKELSDFYAPKLANVRVLHIPFCIEVDKKEYTDKVFEDTYISVGRLSAEKGCLELLDVFSQLKKKRSGATLDIVGDGPLREEMEFKIKQLHLEDSVTMHGFMKLDDIQPMYEKSDMFLMASHSESFGLVLLEAMAHSVCCIAFDSAAGACEIMARGNYGYLISSRNIEEMVDTICTYASDAMLQKKMRKISFERANMYSKEVTCKKWFDLMSQIENE